MEGKIKTVESEIVEARTLIKLLLNSLGNDNETKVVINMVDEKLENAVGLMKGGKIKTNTDKPKRTRRTKAEMEADRLKEEEAKKAKAESESKEPEVKEPEIKEPEIKEPEQKEKETKRAKSSKKKDDKSEEINQIKDIGQFSL